MYSKINRLFGVVIHCVSSQHCWSKHLVHICIHLNAECLHTVSLILDLMEITAVVVDASWGIPSVLCVTLLVWLWRPGDERWARRRLKWKSVTEEVRAGREERISPDTETGRVSHGQGQNEGWVLVCRCVYLLCCTFTKCLVPRWPLSHI